MPEIVLVGKDTFHQPISGIKEKCGHTKNSHLQKDPEGTGVVQILGQMMVNNNQGEETAERQLKIFSKMILLEVFRPGGAYLKKKYKQQKQYEYIHKKCPRYIICSIWDSYSVTVHSVTSNLHKSIKIAYGDGIYALLNHFLTYCAVNAQY